MARVPTIQSHANYFNNLQEDLAWFQSNEKTIHHNDMRIIFSRVYEAVTLEMENMFNEKQFKNPVWVNKLMLKYVSLYRNALDCSLTNSCSISPAWENAFKINEKNSIMPGIQLLYSISAHVNRDLPIALAASDTDFDSSDYYYDFTRISLIFKRKMPELINIVLDYQYCDINFADRKIINQTINIVMNRTRAQAWNYGRALSQTKTIEEENRVLDAIEANTAGENGTIRTLAPASAKMICF